MSVQKEKDYVTACLRLDTLYLSFAFHRLRLQFVTYSTTSSHPSDILAILGPTSQGNISQTPRVAPILQRPTSPVFGFDNASPPVRSAAGLSE